MIINNREIIFITYSTEKNWIAEIPNANWLCILVDHDKPKNHINEVVSKIINNDVCWVCNIGQTSEQIHDLIDEEIAYRGVDVENLHLPNHNIITTWHTDFEEGIWFGIYSANNEDVKIDKVVILDMTDGIDTERINKSLEELIIGE